MCPAALRPRPVDRHEDSPYEDHHRTMPARNLNAANACAGKAGLVPAVRCKGIDFSSLGALIKLKRTTKLSIGGQCLSCVRASAAKWRQPIEERDLVLTTLPDMLEWREINPKISAPDTSTAWRIDRETYSEARSMAMIGRLEALSLCAAVLA